MLYETIETWLKQNYNMPINRAVTDDFGTHNCIGDILKKFGSEFSKQENKELIEENKVLIEKLDYEIKRSDKFEKQYQNQVADLSTELTEAKNEIERLKNQKPFKARLHTSDVLDEFFERDGKIITMIRSFVQDNRHDYATSVYDIVSGKFKVEIEKLNEELKKEKLKFDAVKTMDWGLVFAEILLNMTAGKFPELPFDVSHKVFEGYKQSVSDYIFGIEKAAKAQELISEK